MFDSIKTDDELRKRAVDRYHAAVQCLGTRGSGFFARDPADQVAAQEEFKAALDDLERLGIVKTPPVTAAELRKMLANAPAFAGSDLLAVSREMIRRLIKQLEGYETNAASEEKNLIDALKEVEHDVIRRLRAPLGERRTEQTEAK